MSIHRIVLTGGPCAGKSTGLAIVEQRLTSLGYKVITMEEIATQIINSGLTPMELQNDFQLLLMGLTLDRDKQYEKVISILHRKYDKIIVLYDRGLMDNQAYCSEEDFNGVLKELGIQRNRALTYYDGVFHLVTAADGAEEYYTTENNEARTETPEQARELDLKTLSSWIGHPHLRVISNKERSFKVKMDILLSEITGLLGEPVPLEIERKFLIKMPDIEVLNTKLNAKKSEIIQTYLRETTKGVERRVRQRGNDGDYSYYYTEKTPTDQSGTRIETEEKITEAEYLKLLLEADTAKHQIRKDRYCFVYNGLYYELDIYPFWKNQAILEIEVSDINKSIELPSQIEIIKDVTDDITYKNSSIANGIIGEA